VLADVGGKDFHDRPVIFFRVLGDPLQGVNFSKTHLELELAVFVNRPEWVNRFGKTLGDLPLFGDLQIFVGASDIFRSEIQADEDGKPTKYLSQCRTGAAAGARGRTAGDRRDRHSGTLQLRGRV